MFLWSHGGISVLTVPSTIRGRRTPLHLFDRTSHFRINPKQRLLRPLTTVGLHMNKLPEAGSRLGAVPVLSRTIRERR